MKEKFFEKYAESIEALSRDMAKRFADGKKLLTMGNGGSLCDALHFAVEFTNIRSSRNGAAFPAIPLMTDVATMTAVSNDHRITPSRIFVADQLRLCSANRATWLSPCQYQRQIAESDLCARRPRAKAIDAHGSLVGKRRRPLSGSDRTTPLSFLRTAFIAFRKLTRHP